VTADEEPRWSAGRAATTPSTVETNAGQPTWFAVSGTADGSELAANVATGSTGRVRYAMSTPETAAATAKLAPFERAWPRASRRSTTIDPAAMNTATLPIA
jgi:hypothetical protein